MLTVKVLGPGCSNCHNLEKIARNAVASTVLEASVEKITDIRDITRYAILATPGLVIDEKVVCSGRVPSEAEVSAWLAKAAAGA